MILKESIYHSSQCTALSTSVQDSTPLCSRCHEIHLASSQLSKQSLNTLTSVNSKCLHLLLGKCNNDSIWQVPSCQNNHLSLNSKCAHLLLGKSNKDSIWQVPRCQKKIILPSDIDLCTMQQECDRCLSLGFSISMFTI